MTKAVKELIIVFLVGAGALTLLWGLMYQTNNSPIPGQVILVNRKMWSAIWAGGGLIALGILMGVLLKPAKK